MIDPQKEIDKAARRIKRRSNRDIEEECRRNGMDFEEALKQIEYFHALVKKAGMPDVYIKNTFGIDAPPLRLHTESES